jgi:hypothetical protein
LIHFRSPLNFILTYFNIPIIRAEEVRTNPEPLLSLRQVRPQCRPAKLTQDRNQVRYEAETGRDLRRMGILRMCVINHPGF